MITVQLPDGRLLDSTIDWYPFIFDGVKTVLISDIDFPDEPGYNDRINCNRKPCRERILIRTKSKNHGKIIQRVVAY